MSRGKRLILGQAQAVGLHGRVHRVCARVVNSGPRGQAEQGDAALDHCGILGGAIVRAGCQALAEACRLNACLQMCTGVWSISSSWDGVCESLVWHAVAQARHTHASAQSGVNVTHTCSVSWAGMAEEATV